MTTTRIEKVLRNNKVVWAVMVPGVETDSVFVRKANAEQAVATATALVAAFRAAAERKLSSCDMDVYAAVDEVRYARHSLERELTRVAERASEDLVRVRNGQCCWYDGSDLARSGADVALANAAYKQAYKSFHTACRYAVRAEPLGDTAVGLAVVAFLTGDGSL